MKRILALGALVAAVASASFAARADAILFGTPDGDGHEGVGYVVFYDATRTPLWRCSGSLVSTRIVLTAGHCAGMLDDANGVFRTPVLAQVWFDDEITRSKDYPEGPPVPCAGYRGFPCTGGDSYGVPVPHPQYIGSQAGGFFYDIGVVRLLKAQKRRDVIELAPLGTLDRTPPGTPMKIVGFGTQSTAPPPADFRQRMRGTVQFLRVEGNPSESHRYDDPNYADFTNGNPSGAAACLGDSGGPVLNRQGEIVSVMSIVDPWVDGYCVGDGYHHRTDTVVSQQFLALFGVKVGGSRHDGDGRDDDGRRDDDDRRDRDRDRKHGANNLHATR